MTHVTIVASLIPSTAPSAAGAALAREFTWPDEPACAALADELAQALRDGLLAGGSAYIELHGTLGAGKTTFTRHLLRALGVQGRVKSPSYAVVEPHELPGMVIQHFDFYRFNDPQEWEDAGFRDLFAAPGLKLAEWPEKAEGLLPQPDLSIHIQPLGEDLREVRMQAFSLIGRQALAALQPRQAAGAQAHG